MNKKSEEKEDNTDITTRKKVKAMICECHQMSNEVRKELLWSKTMKYNLNTKYSELHTHTQRNKYSPKWYEALF